MHHWYRYFLHWENQKMLSLLFCCCKVCGVILANAWYVFSSVFDDQDCNATWEGRRAWGPTRGEINFQQKVISAKFNFWRKQLKYVFIENCPRWSRISVSSVWSLSQATTNWSSTSGQFKLCQPSKIGNSPQILVLFLFPFVQGSHGGEAVQVLILRAPVQAIVTCPAAHKASYRWQIKFSNCVILCISYVLCPTPGKDQFAKLPFL